MILKILIKQLKRLILGFSLIITPAFALQGGQPVNASDYPGLVMLSYSRSPNLYNFNLSFPDDTNCTGIVLQPRRVLTSLPCVLATDFGFGILPLAESFVISADNIQIHPVINGEIGGVDTLPPVVKPALMPRVDVSAVVVHPQSDIGIFTSTSSYSLAILYLSADIGIEPAVLYDGSNKFIDFSATALGWESVERTVDATPANYYILRKLNFDLVDGDTNVDGDCYEANDTYTATFFCGGYRNEINYLEDADEGAPIYRTINNRQVAIGLLLRASRSFGAYEKYTRLSTMAGFIKHHAPDTQFESGALAEPLPASQLLLLD